ncbi:MAG: ribonuclease HII [Candidatus Kapaibacterium sp.]|nr:MAG: ribonuclease HII [Candidatus Kapabacteria bacterium]
MAPTRYEQRFWCRGVLVAGVDEAGRGSLAGPVVAAAVVLRPESSSLCRRLRDSKELTRRKREELFEEIVRSAVAWSVGIASVQHIAQRNILGATMHAMQHAVEQLGCSIAHVFVDGPHHPLLVQPTTAIVGGDRCSASIAAASIIAKVTRDRFMEELARQYPQYGFERHKGYPTAEHFAALERWGPTPEHRALFLTKWRARSGQAQLL